MNKDIEDNNYYTLKEVFNSVTFYTAMLKSLKPKKKNEEKKVKEDKERDVYGDVRDFLALLTSSMTVIVLVDSLK
jgi:hypothetical protein